MNDIEWFNKWFTNSTSVVNHSHHSHAPWICVHHSQSLQSPPPRPTSCVLSLKQHTWKVALNAPLRHAASSTVVWMFCACARCNTRVALHYNRKCRNWVHRKNKAHTVFGPSHTPRWFTSTPPIRMVIQLEHNQSENPIRVAPKASNAAEHTEHISSAVEPVCSCR